MNETQPMYYSDLDPETARKTRFDELEAVSKSANAIIGVVFVDKSQITKYPAQNTREIIGEYLGVSGKHGVLITRTDVNGDSIIFQNGKIVKPNTGKNA